MFMPFSSPFYRDISNGVRERVNQTKKKVAENREAVIFFPAYRACGARSHMGGHLNCTSSHANVLRAR